MRLLSVDIALQQVLGALAPIGTEQVALPNALGRAASEAIMALKTLPHHDTSAMDGYACLAAQTTAGVPLRVEGATYPGQAPQRLQPGTLHRITTGAALPVGADAVIQQENTTLAEGLVSILAPVTAGLHVRRRGEDTVAGQVLLQPNQRLGVAEIAALASQGATSVVVRRRPTVAIATSGDELVPFGAHAAEGRTVDSNSLMLALAAEKAGAIVHTLPVAADTPSAIAANVRSGLTADVLLCVAGASVGDKDFTRQALASEGVELAFWRVAMKPGKPLALGRAGKTLVFGLPGNPVSALVTFELFVRPALLAMQGLDPAPTVDTAASSEKITKTVGIRHFVRGVVSDGKATPLTNQSSGALTSVIGATHLLDLPEESGIIEKGQSIRCLRVSW
jgi:molybdopterin molybdotransferase